MAAIAGTRTTPASMKKATESLRKSDRAQAITIEGLMSGDPRGGLLSPKFSIPQAKNQVAKSDKEFEGDTSGVGVDNP